MQAHQAVQGAVAQLTGIRLAQAQQGKVMLADQEGKALMTLAAVVAEQVLLVETVFRGQVLLLVAQVALVQQAQFLVRQLHTQAAVEVMELVAELLAQVVVEQEETDQDQQELQILVAVVVVR